MTPVLAAEDLRVVLGGRTVIAGASLSLSAGEFVLLLGRSGTGKSVLIKAALGFLPVAGGTVRLDGQPRDPARQGAALRDRVVLVHQAPALLDDETALHNVALPWCWRTGGSARAGRQRAARALEQLGAAALAPREAASLSAGERKLVSLARALAVEPRAVLLDEPTTGLDAASARRVALACATVQRAGTAVLVVTHDVQPFHDVATRVCLLHGGRVLSDRRAADAWARPDEALAQFLAGAVHGPLSQGVAA
ncbi:MAG: ATP-binding cassette domain-containing protein [Deltaproteobacteria bacterium]|nr:ATP-binding cassette domain-containing protein [Deltaproteobacteria bacterium]